MAIVKYNVWSISIHMQKFNLGTVRVSDLEFESSFAITMQQETECHVREFHNTYLAEEKYFQNMYTMVVSAIDRVVMV